MDNEQYWHNEAFSLPQIKHAIRNFLGKGPTFCYVHTFCRAAHSDTILVHHTHIVVVENRIGLSPKTTLIGRCVCEGQGRILLHEKWGNFFMIDGVGLF